MSHSYETLVRIAETTIRERRRRAEAERVAAATARPDGTWRPRLARLLRVVPFPFRRRARRSTSERGTSDRAPSRRSACEACA